MIHKFLFGVSILFLISCNNSSSPNYDNSLPMPKVNNIPAPAPIMFKVEAVYPHDPGAFTQGLEFYKGKMYEGTGEYGTSNLRIVDIKTGKVEKDYLIPDSSIFGEGITIFKNKIYQLTWQSHKIFVYSLDDITHPISTLKWDREGWGATHDDKNIIISDGSSHLYFVQPDEKNKDMKIDKILTVANNMGEVDSLNELELIGGYIYANRWLTNDIVKIDTATGYVVGDMNLTGLLQQYDPNAKVNGDAVLNGIAYDSTTKNLYITGKDWPKMFEMKLN
ncbi:MAG TPA: glutaminyl-peptide cyclotransferase [Hanamia sp.]|nr:glutaminyl-peptide cyclotransferase [Hanamia sp.]